MDYGDIRRIEFSTCSPECVPVSFHINSGDDEFDEVVNLLRKSRALEQQSLYGKPENEGISWKLRLYGNENEDRIYKGKGVLPEWFRPVYGFYEAIHHNFNTPEEDLEAKYPDIASWKPLNILWGDRLITQTQARTMFLLTVDSGALIRGYQILRRLNRPAELDDWDCLPMPEQSVVIPANIALTTRQVDAASWGFVPYETGDNWFICQVDRELRFYSSWTGYPVYFAKISPDKHDNSSWHISEVLANKDESQVTVFSEEQDLLIVEALVKQRSELDVEDILFEVVDLEEGPQVRRHLKAFPDGGFCLAYNKIIEMQRSW